MHVHTVFGDWLPRNERCPLPLFVANGITGVRDMGGDLDVLKEWRAAIAPGRLLGPRMIIAGPMLDGPVPRFPSSAPVATPADGRRWSMISGAGRRLHQDPVAHSARRVLRGGGRGEEARHRVRRSRARCGARLRGVQRGTEEHRAFHRHLRGMHGHRGSAHQGSEEPRRQRQDLRSRPRAGWIALMAKNQTWQVPTLVWERGQWLVDDIDKSTIRSRNMRRTPGRTTPGPCS
jgi:hypothetical protein